ncbi:hypothetical protein BVRB_8g181380 isoform B [Beta vulgaris subsp. vulgaris]|nr:hypothetical protein BVRB_8g181380 isoform B [Beta vulgaris subsp. vulgaris]
MSEYEDFDERQSRKLKDIRFLEIGSGFSCSTFRDQLFGHQCYVLT